MTAQPFSGVAAITSLSDLEAMYGPEPVPAAIVKQIDFLTAQYQRLVEASPFMVLASVGRDGLDCSPRGDCGQVASALNDRLVAIPDRRGNNRIDSLRNIVSDGRVALLFLIPGSGTMFRINGLAVISADADVCNRFAIGGKPPRTVLLVTVQAAYFQCARAVVRSALWDAGSRVDPTTLPTPGAMLAALSSGEVGGDLYDAEWPERAARSLW